MANWCIVYLASPRDHRVVLDKPLMLRHDLLKASMELARRAFPDTDIYVFHEDYTVEDKAQLPHAKEFIQVDFDTNTDVYVNLRNRPKGYMMMCRFFSGVMQKHPILQKYTHYMRLDDDSYFLKPYPDAIDVAQFLSNDYTYRSILPDKGNVGLFDYTVEFLVKNGIPKHVIYQAIKRVNGLLDHKGEYTGIAPYNNYHVSSLKLWNHPLVSAYIDSLEKDKCILTRGWMDANIHAMIIFLIAPVANLKIAESTRFGYRHNHHVSPLHTTGVYYDANLSFVETP